MLTQYSFLLFCLIDGKTYDAYVIYPKNHTSEANFVEYFVYQVMPDILENKCGYKLCIYGRDIYPGEGKFQIWWRTELLVKLEQVVILVPFRCTGGYSIFLTLKLISSAAICLLFQARWHKGTLCFPVCLEKQATMKGHRLLIILECTGNMTLSVTLSNIHLLFGKSNCTAIIWAKPQPNCVWDGLADYKTRKRRNPQIQLRKHFCCYHSGVCWKLMRFQPFMRVLESQEAQLGAICSPPELTCLFILCSGSFVDQISLSVSRHEAWAGAFSVSHFWNHLHWARCHSSALSWCWDIWCPSLLESCERAAWPWEKRR